MREALLTITTKQPELMDDMTYTVRAEIFEENNEIQIKYVECLTDNEPVDTTLYIKDDNIYLERIGGLAGDMYFQENSTYEAQYTLFDDFSVEMRIFTTNLLIDKKPEGLEAKVDYQLSIAGKSLGKMSLDVSAQYL